MAHYALSCGGTVTKHEERSWDDFPEHHALHEAVRELQRDVNAIRDLARDGHAVTEHCGECRGDCSRPVYLGKIGRWRRFVLTRYLRTRSE